MKYAICCIPVSPLRKEPSHRSEMVSQQLFGESCIVIEEAADGWLKVSCSFDGYEGWCQQAELVACDEAEYHSPLSGLAAGWVNEVEYRSQRMFIPMGSSIRTNMPALNKHAFRYEGEVRKVSGTARNEDTICGIAFSFLNTSYLWGGKSIFGIDCSGFTQTVFKFLDYKLERDAYLQEQQGTLLASLSAARCGDLAFFNNAQNRIVHVGILLNDQEIIHASGKVRIDAISKEGIVQADTSRLTHHLFSVRRYFNEMP